MSLIACIWTACLLYYGGLVLRAAWYFSCARPALSSSPLPRVSVIVPARNEAASIHQCLVSILCQDYPQELVEVVLVNDHSTDDTADIARQLAREHPRLQVLDLDIGGIYAYKKAAITAGVQHSSGEIIIQTDADCEMGRGWLRSMVHSFEPGVALVSGPVRLRYTQSLFQRMQALEHMGLVALGAGSLLAGRPNMCNGANLAYRRSAFEAVKGFEGVDVIASGDDELLMQKIRKLPGGRLGFCKNRQAIVDTPALTSWAAFKAQRLRWVSKSRYYPNRWVTFSQVMAYLAHAGFVVFGIMAWQQGAYATWWGMAFIAKLLVDASLLCLAAVFFRNLPLLWLLIPMQPLYMLYVLWIGLAGNMRNTYTWKGRTVK